MLDDYQEGKQSEPCGNDDTEITGLNGRGMLSAINSVQRVIIRNFRPL